MFRKVPSVVALDRAAVGSAVDDAQMHGLGHMNARVAAAVIAELFFPERNEADRRDAAGQLHDLMCTLADTVAAAHPRELRQTLKKVLANLEYVAEAFEIGRRPRGTRKIGPDALMAMTGRLPTSLVPAGGGVDFADFGRLQVGALNSSATASGPMIPIDRASGLLPAILDFSSADGRVTAIWSRSLSVWPRSLAALGLGPEALPTQPIYSGRVRRLPDHQKRELAELAIAARQWVKLCFGVASRNDPLCFKGAGLVLPPATALLLCGLEDIICPWPDTRPAKEILEKLREPLPTRQRGLNGMNRSLYQLLFDVVRRRVRTTGCDEATFRLKAGAVGLINADKEADAFDRYVEGHVRTFVQIGAINAARLYIQELFRATQVDMADLEVGTDEENRISPQDYHELGRWSDHLKARLKLGLVDHATFVRFHHERAIWSFPSKLPRNVSAQRLAWYLVLAARRARATTVRTA